MTVLQELPAPDIGSSVRETSQEQLPDPIHNLGSLALETETPIGQTLLSDYDSRPFERNSIAYKQVQITTYQNGRLVTANEVARGRRSSDPDQNPKLASKDLARAVNDIYWSVAAFQRSRSINKDVLPAFGYDTGTYTYNDRGTTNRDNTAEVFYPSQTTLEVRLQDLRDKTGFAPDIARFDGNKFTLMEQADSLIDGRPLIATGLYDEPHDVLTHLPGWLALPKVTYDWLATELKRLKDQGLEMNDFLLKRIENCIDVDLMDSALKAASKQSTTNKELNATYRLLLFGDQFVDISLTPQQEVLLNTHVTALIERAAEIRDWALGQGQDSVQLQAV